MKTENRVKYVYEHKEVYGTTTMRYSKTFASFFAQRRQVDEFQKYSNWNLTVLIVQRYMSFGEKTMKSWTLYFFDTENLNITLFSLNFLNIISKYILSFSYMPGIITLAARDKKKRLGIPCSFQGLHLRGC